MSDSFDGERVAAGSSSAETVAASLETFAEERPDAAAGVAPVAPVATFDTAGETRAPPPFAWAPWRRGGGQRQRSGSGRCVQTAWTWKALHLGACHALLRECESTQKAAGLGVADAVW